MRLVSIREFSVECGRTYECIRQQIGKKIIPESTKPIRIDADKYSFIVEFCKNQAKSRCKK